ncbi:uncharacterized protein LOC112575937 [Pomacea canaliculata]|uniref:uncharacterized protein LOC112575937 n=1 Tax=Pomacea canaliculata TaxID=400727 RepID=UPI000D730CB9|nr:uncharacterized protein LOC112575937 [Pomacea canaliculata]
MEWLRCGHHVHVVSTCTQSRAACRMLYYLLLRAVSTQQLAGVSPNKLHFLQHDFFVPEGSKKALDDFVKAATKGSLYVLADEAQWIVDINIFCDEVLRQVPLLHLWAASYFFKNTPAGWQVECLTRPLRSPPAVVREVEQDASFVRDGAVQSVH